MNSWEKNCASKGCGGAGKCWNCPFYSYPVLWQAVVWSWWKMLCICGKLVWSDNCSNDNMLFSFDGNWVS